MGVKALCDVLSGSQVKMCCDVVVGQVVFSIC